MIITDAEDKTNEKTKKIGELEESECDVPNYPKLANEIKQLAVFNLEQGDVNGFNVLHTAEIHLKNCFHMIKI